MEFLTVILIIALLAVLILLLLASKRGEPSYKKDAKRDNNADLNFQSENYPSNNEGTRILPDLYIDQLSAKNQRPIKTFAVSVMEIYNKGVSISGCGHKYEDGKLLLEKTPDAYTVSDYHISIGYDDEGFFCQDHYGSRNGVYQENSRMRVKKGVSIPIEHGMKLRLGSQWIRFRLAEHLITTPDTQINDIPDKTMPFKKPRTISR